MSASVTSAKQQAVYFADTVFKAMVEYKVAILSSLALRMFLMPVLFSNFGRSTK